MLYFVEELKKWETYKLIDEKWYCARPIPASFLCRLHYAWTVLIGKADAVTWYKQ